MVMCFFFFFKQKTAYEMRISDWSSDVCSSDLPGSGSWMERLMGAPLSGGIRYNGPAGTLFSFAGLSDQTLSGAIGVAADFSGRLPSPQFTGLVRANKLTHRTDRKSTRLNSSH